MGVCQSCNEEKGQLASPRITAEPRPVWVRRGSKNFPKDTSFLATSSPDPPRVTAELGNALIQASGSFFTVQSLKQTVCISALVGAGFAGEAKVEVFMCSTGSAAAHLDESAAWSKVAGGTLRDHCSTRLPLDTSVRIEAGCQCGFYVLATSHNGRDTHVCANPAQPSGVAASDDQISIITSWLIEQGARPVESLAGADYSTSHSSVISGGIEYRLYESAMVDAVWAWADIDKDGFLNFDEASKLLQLAGDDTFDEDQFEEICEVLGADVQTGVTKQQFEDFYANGHGDIVDVHEHVFPKLTMGSDKVC